MKTTAYRWLDKLTPQFKIKVEKFIQEVNKNWKIIFITESWRTQERQNELLKWWFSQVKHSNHQDWLAIDIWFFGRELYPSDFSKWRKVWDIAKKYQIDWGWDLWEWDKPHFQDNWKALKENIIPNIKPMNKYTDILANIVKNWYDPIFESHEWFWTLTEWETKTLIEIWLARAIERVTKK